MFDIPTLLIMAEIDSRSIFYRVKRYYPDKLRFLFIFQAFLNFNLINSFINISSPLCFN